MYDRHYGSHYDAALSTKEIAAIARKNFRKAAKEDGSPLAGWGVSVRYESFAGGSAIETKLKAPEGVHAVHEWADTSYAGERDADNVCLVCGVQFIAERRVAQRWGWLSEAGRNAKAYAEAVLGGYNHDGSEVQIDYFDVNFYGQVEVFEG